MLKPEQGEFIELSHKYRIVPVYTTFVADRETPITLYEKINQENPVFLLESGMGREKLARYSFIGLDPFMKFESYGCDVCIREKEEAMGEDGWEERWERKNPLLALKELYNIYNSPPIRELPRFYGGGVGYFGYESVNYIEKNKNFSLQKKDNLEVPDICLVFPRYIVIYDHLFHKLTLVKNVDVTKMTIDGDEGTGFEEKYRLEKLKLLNIKQKLIENKTCLEGADEEGRIYPEKQELIGTTNNMVVSSYSPGYFKESVKKAREYIEEGEIFQVVLSRCQEVEIDKPPWDIYRELRTVNPSPYMYYLDFKDFTVLGASPEMLIRQEHRDIYTRPIAGTRPRGRDENEDKRLATELKNDPKERAEHLMLIDLGRNDIGKVSEFGSVEITEEFKIENFSHVMHMVSEVKGKLQEKFDMIDTLMACLPAGTVTGAPKVRAMEIIDEFEPVKRGPYSGGVGYMAFNGNMDVALTIRTLVIKHDKAYIQTGAGIVADSIPEREYEETLSKAEAMLKVLGVSQEKQGKN